MKFPDDLHRMIYIASYVVYNTHACKPVKSDITGSYETVTFFKSLLASVGPST